MPMGNSTQPLFGQIQRSTSELFVGTIIGKRQRRHSKFKIFNFSSTNVILSVANMVGMLANNLFNKEVTAIFRLSK